MRSRNENGRYRQKRGDALVGNLEKKYGSDFGVRSDMKLETLRRQHGGQSLTQLLKEQHDKN
ncbi:MULTISPECIES: hypothetical protein [Paenibacillus]|uniref:Uncharacterized protein n=2 Tax=Paenibacillus TaxID=44249 RepID=A0A089M549_9BACL|nr:MULTISPECIES: hypothetical protein [Paenibacillus]AIQ68352.1 hypothetical protein PGRAT_12570 [Paenibacillus graminis]MEC0169326.1 hypothetical protein [Paenibacillus graminis]CQR55132.1 hypothetical protein PRIO_2728 [Paenibacillus riograndensis SBR5]